MARLISEFQITVTSSAYAQSEENLKVRIGAEYWLNELNGFNLGFARSPRKLIEYLIPLRNSDQEIQGSLQNLVNFLIDKGSLHKNLVLFADLVANQPTSYLDAVEILNYPFLTLNSDAEISIEPKAKYLATLLVNFDLAINNTMDAEGRQELQFKSAARRMIDHLKYVNSDTKLLEREFVDYQNAKKELFNVNENVRKSLQSIFDYLATELIG